MTGVVETCERWRAWFGVDIAECAEYMTDPLGSTVTGVEQIMVEFVFGPAGLIISGFFLVLFILTLVILALYESRKSSHHRSHQG